jgi:sugar phosphate isomerase/epimerase
MICPGLVSVTFRQLKPREIVDLTRKAGLHGIEWGGDIHVPHGDIKTAEEVHKMTIDSGLSVTSYGSYYRVGCEDDNFDLFRQVLETAVKLEAPVIRVWAGTKASSDADDKYRERVAWCSKKIAELAEPAGINISFEYHGGTLTDTLESALALYDRIHHKNIRSYWQPRTALSPEENKKELESVLPLLSNIHVFHWTLDDHGNTLRHPLADGKEVWKNYLSCLKGLPDKRYALLEFVEKDDPAQFLKDAQVLKELLD